jgi:hypothetical protein
MGFPPGVVHRLLPGPADPGLHGTGRVADDLYLIAHHEVSGRPYLSSRAAGIALAAGLLAELIAAPHPAVTVDRGCVVPLYRPGGPAARRVLPAEPVAGHLLELITAESPPRPVRDWLLFAGRTAPAQVAGRLEHAGYLTRPAGRARWRAGRPVPVQANWSRCALLRAHAALEDGRTLTPHLALLAALTVACGLAFRFAEVPRPPARDAAQAARMLPGPVHELIAHVQAAAGAAVLSART